MDNTYLNPGEIAAMEREALKGRNGGRNAMLIKLLFHLGCRISELLALTPQQVDTEGSTVTLKLLKKRLKVYCPKCKSRLGRQSKFCQVCGEKVEEAVKEASEKTKQRILPLDRPTMAMLKKAIEVNKIKPDERLFPFSRDTAHHIVTTVAAMAGIKDILNPETGRRHHPSPHRLRDAFATMAIKRSDSPDSIRMLQERLGHESIATTMRYVKVAGKQQKDWLDKIWDPGEEDSQEESGD